MPSRQTLVVIPAKHRLAVRAPGPASMLAPCVGGSRIGHAPSGMTDGGYIGASRPPGSNRPQFSADLAFAGHQVTIGLEAENEPLRQP